MEEKIEALEKQVQELRERIRAQERRELLICISFILLAVGTGIGFWRVHGYLIRISLQIREVLDLNTGILQQIGDLVSCVGELLQQGNLF